MRTRNYAAVAVLAATAVAAAAGTANAAPAPAAAPAQPVVVSATDFLGAVAHQVLDPTATHAPAALVLPTGTVTVGDGQIGMIGPSGTVSVGTPLAPVSAALAPVAPALLNTVDSTIPAATTPVAAHVATTPAAASVPGIHTVADARFKTWQEREQWEFNRFKDGVSMTGTIAAATGAAGGALIGCAVGAVAAQAVDPVFIPLMGPLAPLGTGAIGCAGGAAALGALGAGTVGLLITLPVAAGLGINYLVQSQQPFTAPPAPPKS